MCMYAGVFYVSHTENVCFRLENRTFHGWETYSSRMKDIKNISSCRTIQLSIFLKHCILVIFL